MAQESHATETEVTPRRQRNRREKTKQGELFRILGHPLRVEILVALSQRVGSPKELAAELVEPLGNVSYHVRQLEEAGMIELADTRPVRGAVEHFYRATARPVIETEDWEKMDQATRDALIRFGLTKIADDATLALEAGTFDLRPERHLSRTPMVLDAKGWKDALSIVDGALGELLEVQAEATARMAGTADTGMPVTAAMLCFEMPEPSRE